MPINVTPQEAVALLVTQAETVWTTHEQTKFLAELLTSNVWADRFDENDDLRHEPSYTDGLEAGYSDGEDARDAENSETVAALEREIDRLEKINAALDVKLAELERKKP
jgi:hypothetical protein